MPVTSDTLFHFTASLRNIENILSKKFQLTYCTEEYILGGDKHRYHIPMVCFCDLPLTLAKEHIRNYGNYAIGLKKEWGIKHKLNPVVYIEKDSTISNDLNLTLTYLNGLIDEINKMQDKSQSESSDINLLENNMKKIAYSNMNVLRYVKNYAGDLGKDDKLSKDDRINREYRFYDEREWRFVPNWDHEKIKFSLSDDEYRTYRKDKKLPKQLLGEITLNFTASDIKYLIVKSTEDIPKLIKCINETNDLTKNPVDAQILTTKILTIEQLNNDF